MTNVQAQLDSTAEHILGDVNAPVDPARKAILVKHLGVVNGEVRVVDDDGNARTRGHAFWTFRELVEWLLNDPVGEDARTLRWRPFGKSIPPR